MKTLSSSEPSFRTVSTTSGSFAAIAVAIGDDLRLGLVGEPLVEDLDEDLHLLVADVPVGGEQLRAPERDGAHDRQVQRLERVAARQLHQVVDGVLQRVVADRLALHRVARPRGLGGPREQLDRLQADRQQRV